MAIVGYWRLNGNSNDASGNGYNGTASGITYSQANGVLNGGAGFNGISYISLPSLDTPLSNTFTWSGWVRQSSITNLQIIWVYDNADTPELKVFTEYSAGNVRFRASVYDAANYQCELMSPYYTYNVNKWWHVAMVAATNDFRLYVNGILVATDTSGSFNIDGMVEHKIGYYARGAVIHPKWNGSIDEVIIDNTAWAPARVKNEYSRVKGFF